MKGDRENQVETGVLLYPLTFRCFVVFRRRNILEWVILSFTHTSQHYCSDWLLPLTV